MLCVMGAYLLSARTASAIIQLSFYIYANFGLLSVFLSLCVSDSFCIELNKVTYGYSKYDTHGPGGERARDMLNLYINILRPQWHAPIMELKAVFLRRKNVMWLASFVFSHRFFSSSFYLILFHADGCMCVCAVLRERISISRTIETHLK